MLFSQHRLNGWYYRVLQSGNISLNDEFLLQQRPNTNVTVDTMLKVIYGMAESQTVELATNAIGLDPEWQKRLRAN